MKFEFPDLFPEPLFLRFLRFLKFLKFLSIICCLEFKESKGMLGMELEFPDSLIPSFGFLRFLGFLEFLSIDLFEFEGAAGSPEISSLRAPATVLCLDNPEGGPHNYLRFAPLLRLELMIRRIS